MSRKQNADLAAIEDLAEEIEGYLRRGERLADTVEGITEWWLTRQRLQEEKQKVRRALDFLCQKGLIEKRTLPDGQTLYRAIDLAGVE